MGGGEITTWIFMYLYFCDVFSPTLTYALCLTVSCPPPDKRISITNAVAAIVLPVISEGSVGDFIHTFCMTFKYHYVKLLVGTFVKTAKQKIFTIITMDPIFVHWSLTCFALRLSVFPFCIFPISIFFSHLKKNVLYWCHDTYLVVIVLVIISIHIDMFHTSNVIRFVIVVWWYHRWEISDQAQWDTSYKKR